MARHLKTCKVKKEKAKNDSILLQKIKELEEENKVIKQKINILETTKTNKKTKNPTQIINNKLWAPQILPNIHTSESRDIIYFESIL